jgi:hypothetical protein
MGFVFLRLAFQDISGGLFHARKVHQKKGFILSSISALRLLLHVHIRLQRTPSIYFTTPDYDRRDSHVLFAFTAILDTTRLRLAILHPAPISPIGPIVRYMMTAKNKKVQ